MEGWRFRAERNVRDVSLEPAQSGSKTCTGGGGWSGSKAVTGGSAPPVNPTATTTYFNGTLVASVPVTGLCSDNTYPLVWGTGPWTWTCSGSGGGGNASCNFVLERGMVRTLQESNKGAIDQWFVLDIPADYSNPGYATHSKVWSAGSMPSH